LSCDSVNTGQKILILEKGGARVPPFLFNEEKRIDKTYSLNENNTDEEGKTPSQSFSPYQGG
jgi:hypothetical protein